MEKSVELWAKIFGMSGAVGTVIVWVAKLGQRVSVLEDKNCVPGAACEKMQASCVAFQQARFDRDEELIKEIKEIIHCMKKERSQDMKDILSAIKEVR